MKLENAVKGVSIDKGCSYNIGFNDGDETQFDVDSFEDLQECWIGFCSENSIPTDCVDYVEYAGKVVKELEQKIFIAHRRYEGSQQIIVLADTHDEAQQIAVEYFSLQSVTVRELKPMAQDGRVYEI